MVVNCKKSLANNTCWNNVPKNSGIVKEKGSGGAILWTNSQNMNLAAAVGKSLDEITAIFAKNWCPARVVRQSISPHSRTPDLTEHGDIHPNPGPTDRSFKLWSCNCGRGTGSWEAFALAMSEKVDVLALQEDALTPTERESFVRYVTKDIYRIFEGCSRMRN